MELTSYTNMIKARAGNTVFLGLDRENVNRLFDNKPMLIKGSELGLGNLKIVILAGETLESVKDDLKSIGIISE